MLQTHRSFFVTKYIYNYLIYLQSYHICEQVKGHPSMLHPSIPFILEGMRVGWCLSPEVIKREPEYTLDRSPVHHRGHLSKAPNINRFEKMHATKFAWFILKKHKLCTKQYIINFLEMYKNFF